MTTLLAIHEIANHLLVLASVSDSLAEGIRNFIGPLLMLAIGIFALNFLVKREMTQFIIYLVVVVIVCLLFYGPDLLKNLAHEVSTNSGSGGTWKG